jgi:hypothetical protein
MCLLELRSLPVLSDRRSINLTGALAIHSEPQFLSIEAKDQVPKLFLGLSILFATRFGVPTLV